MIDHLSEGSFEFRKRRGERRATWINDDVPLWIEFRPVPAERFPHTPLDAVPDHAAADRAIVYDSLAQASGVDARQVARSAAAMPSSSFAE